MLDQFDLFSVASDSVSPAHSTLPLEASHKQQSNDGLPVQNKCDDTPIKATSELYEFVLKYAHRIWPKGWTT